ncbi:hypothetical protein [Hymenobacter properus]|uniref:Uncharacterized protein n=1 Tax=Hymenobacter properus TaxID=2791026 RepID=A0A931FLM4_9BACT|nr:hypothetical protein [Hymenobacter properus]MBF9140834.1 hypothetical protein [Hymenobacter properus]MBR7719643.1 hypothetical protein [Microvirga sp. SRT04]
MKTLLRKLQACWHLLRAPRYFLYTALDAEANLHRWNYSEKVLGGDVSNLLAFGVEIGNDDQEATEGIAALLNDAGGIRPAAQWPDE